eukprot:3177693-Rhodomonas_salina.1
MSGNIMLPLDFGDLGEVVKNKRKQVVVQSTVAAAAVAAAVAASAAAAAVKAVVLCASTPWKHTAVSIRAWHDAPEGGCVSKACARCRRLKLKCTDNRPCKRCARRKEPNDCNECYPDSSQDVGGVTQPTDTDSQASAEQHTSNRENVPVKHRIEEISEGEQSGNVAYSPTSRFAVSQSMKEMPGGHTASAASGNESGSPVHRTS